MAFRRPRVNVRPNVQATRPVSNTGRSLETSVESTSSLQEEQPIDLPVVPTVIEESVSEVEEIIEAPPQILPPVPLPIVSLPAPPSSPPPLSYPTATRTLFRRKIAPNIGVKTAVHHRRPSASCSGTESENESSRQKYSTTSSITFGRIAQPLIKPIVPNESQLSLPSDPPINGDISTSTKTEAMLIETSEAHTLFIDTNPSQIASLPSRINSKISREYLSQHIAYRAQRLASKVEPEMTIRKRRAATLKKLDETGGNKGGPIDTSKLTIADFVHYNPVDNPMEIKVKTTTTTTDTFIDPVRKQSISSNDEQNLAPQLKVGDDGVVFVDETSLTIQVRDDIPRHTVIVEGRFNDDNLTHQSYRKIGRRKRWNNRDTLRFYQALRMCGTDFTLIARVFPNRDRDDIKRKFKTEDKANRTLVDSALSQRIPFDLTCFYSPSEESSDEENGSDMENVTQKKRRMIKRKTKKTSSSDPLEINRRREKRLQTKKNSMRIKKSAEFINDDDDEDESSMDVADTVEVMTTAVESKREQVIPSNPTEENSIDNSITNIAELENLLGKIDGSHLLFVHNTDETTGLDRIDVHVVIPNTTDQTAEHS